MWVLFKSGQYLRLTDNKHREDASSSGISRDKQTAQTWAESILISTSRALLIPAAQYEKLAETYVKVFALHQNEMLKSLQVLSIFMEIR